MTICHVSRDISSRDQACPISSPQGTLAVEIVPRVQCVGMELKETVLY